MQALLMNYRLLFGPLSFLTVGPCNKFSTISFVFSQNRCENQGWAIRLFSRFGSGSVSSVLVFF